MKTIATRIKLFVLYLIAEFHYAMFPRPKIVDIPGRPFSQRVDQRVRTPRTPLEQALTQALSELLKSISAFTYDDTVEVWPDLAQDYLHALDLLTNNQCFGELLMPAFVRSYPAREEAITALRDGYEIFTEHSEDGKNWLSRGISRVNAIGYTVVPEGIFPEELTLPSDEDEVDEPSVGDDNPSLGHEPVESICSATNKPFSD